MDNPFAKKSENQKSLSIIQRAMKKNQGNSTPSFVPLLPTTPNSTNNIFINPNSNYTSNFNSNLTTTNPIIHKTHSNDIVNTNNTNENLKKVIPMETVYGNTKQERPISPIRKLEQYLNNDAPLSVISAPQLSSSTSHQSLQPIISNNKDNSLNNNLLPKIPLNTIKLNQDLNKVIKISIQFSNYKKIQFSINQKIGFKQPIKIPKLQKIQNFEIYKTIKQKQLQKIYNQYYLSLSMNCLQMSRFVSRNINHQFHSTIIGRIKKGLFFYVFSNQRNEQMNKIIQQSQNLNQNIDLINQINQYSNKYTIDKAMSFYIINQINKSQLIEKQIKNNPILFIMEDRVYLLKLYKQLYQNGRLSSKKQISKQQQVQTLYNILGGYQFSYKQNTSIYNYYKNLLQKQIIQLLSVIIVKNYKDIKEQQFNQFIIDLMEKLAGMFPEGHELRGQLDKLFLNIVRIWPTQIKNFSKFSKIMVVMQFYQSNKQYSQEYRNNLQSMYNKMIKLNQISIYDDNMKKLIQNKIQQFAQYEKTNNNPNKKLLILMQTVLLLNQYNKFGNRLLNYKQSQQILTKLYMILFKICPVSFVYYFSQNLTKNNHENIYKYQQMLFLIICRYYKTPSNKYISIQQLNKLLPHSYKIKPNSQNNIILIYIMKILNYYQLNKFDSNRNNLQAIQNNLNVHIKLGLTGIPKKLNLVSLIQIHLKLYTKQIKNYINIIEPQQKANIKLQLKQFLYNYKLCIQSLIKIYIQQQQKQNKQKKLIIQKDQQSGYIIPYNACQNFTYDKLLNNIITLFQCLLSSNIYQYYYLQENVQYLQQTYRQLLQIIVKLQLPKYFNSQQQNSQNINQYTKLILKVYQNFQKNVIYIENKYQLLQKKRNKQIKHIQIIYIVTILKIQKLYLINQDDKMYLYEKINDIYDNKVNIISLLNNSINLYFHSNIQININTKKYIIMSLQTLYVILKNILISSKYENLIKFIKQKAKLIIQLLLQLLDAVDNGNFPIQYFQKQQQCGYCTFNPVFYCDLIGQIMNIVNSENNTNKQQQVKQKNKSYNSVRENTEKKKFQILDFYKDEITKQIKQNSLNFYQQIIKKVYGNFPQNKYENYIKISFTELILKYDRQLLNKITDNYDLEIILPHILKQLQKQHKFLKMKKHNNNLSDNTQNTLQSICVYNAHQEYMYRCFNIFLGLLSKNLSYNVQKFQRIFDLFKIFEYVMDNTNIQLLIRNININSNNNNNNTIMNYIDTKIQIIRIVLYTQRIFLILDNPLKLYITFTQNCKYIKRLLKILCILTPYYNILFQSQKQLNKLYPYQKLNNYIINIKIKNLLTQLLKINLFGRQMQFQNVIMLLPLVQNITFAISNPQIYSQYDQVKNRKHFLSSFVLLHYVAGYIEEFYIKLQEDIELSDVIGIQGKLYIQNSIKFTQRLQKEVFPICQIFNKQKYKIAIQKQIVTSEQIFTAIHKQLQNQQKKLFNIKVKSKIFTNYNNQSIINQAMKNKQSFQHCYNSLIKQLLENQNNVRKNNQNFNPYNKNNTTIYENKFKSYYFIYCFYRNILQAPSKNSQCIQYFYEQNTNKQSLQVFSKIQQTIDTNVRELFYHLMQQVDPIHPQFKAQIAWKSTILLVFLKIHLNYLRKGIFPQWILQFCHRNLFYLVEKQNKQEGLLDWIIHVKNASIMVLVARTKFYSLNRNNRLTKKGAIKCIFAIMEEHLMKWNKTRCQQHQKFKQINITPYQQIKSDQDKNINGYKQNKNNNKTQQKISSIQIQKQLSQYKFVNNQYNIEQYMKINMILISISVTLNYYRQDITSYNAASELFKQNFIPYVQNVMIQFVYFYDNFIKNTNNEKNLQILNENQNNINKGLTFYHQNQTVTKNVNYLNKIFKQYINFSFNMIKQILQRKRQNSIEKHSLSAIMYYNFIEEALQVLGFAPTYKFRQNTKTFENMANIKAKSMVATNFRTRL